jgi:hypothetical protein
MFGFYRADDGTYELRTYGVVRTSHGSIGDFSQKVTGIPADVMVEVYMNDGRYLWFTCSDDTVTLMGWTMIPPE